MFNILDLDTRTLVIDYVTNEPLYFETGEHAGNYCKLSFEKRYQPRKAIADKNWREREQKKFKARTYFLPDFLKPYAIVDHFLHISLDKTGLLCYTKSEEKGAMNIQTRISLKGYLEENFSMLPVEEKKRLLEQYEIYSMELDGLKIAMTPDDIGEVYMNFCPDTDGVNGSCMRNKPQNYSLKMHPTIVYGAGDLGVAYIQNDKGLTTSRALVYPKRKIYSRVYGKPILHDLLKKRGYRKGSYFSGDKKTSMVGARLLCIPISKESDLYIMPYIDEAIPAKLIETSSKKYFRLSHKGNYPTRDQSGRTRDNTPSFECPHCGNIYRGRQIQTQEVYIRSGDSEMWCLSCTQKHTYRCTGYNIYVSNSLPLIHVEGGRVVSPIYARDNCFQCEFSKKYYFRDKMSRQHVITLKGLQVWSNVVLAENTWVCAFTHVRISNELTPIMVKNKNGKMAPCNPYRITHVATLVDGVYVQILERK